MPTPLIMNFPDLLYTHSENLSGRMKHSTKVTFLAEQKPLNHSFLFSFRSEVPNSRNLYSFLNIGVLGKKPPLAISFGKIKSV